MAKETESGIQAAICEYLAYRRHFFFRCNNVPVFHEGRFRALPKHTPRGLPDIILIEHGRFVGLEVKTKEGRQSPDQKEFERASKEAGASYYVVHSVDEVHALGF